MKNTNKCSYFKRASLGYLRRFSIGWILFFTFFSLGINAQNTDPSLIRFVNKGKMNVKANNSATFYIPNAVLMRGTNCLIVQNGTTAIGGSFFQDSQTNVFAVNTTGWGTSTGTVSFVLDHPGKKRYITTKNHTNLENFERADYYVAFPTLRINTADTIMIPGRMGLDATKIEQPKTGILYLASNIYLVNSIRKVFDASLRLSGVGATSSALVPAGSVIIERDVDLYCIGDATDYNPRDYPLFAFASPMETQKSGYFAGNWVRKLRADASNNGTVRYVFGDETQNGTIIRGQYLYDPQESFVPGSGYLVRARPNGYDYNRLKIEGGLCITNSEPSFYNALKFIFNGEIYDMQHNVKEQVFAQPVLYSQTLNKPTAIGSTVNWIIGNSYTSAIDGQALAQQIVNSSLVFDPNIYLFLPGATTYQPYSVQNSPIQVIGLTDVPSQSLFMVRLDKHSPQIGTFRVDRSMTTHGIRSHNFRSEESYDQEILFKVSPEGNDHLFDLAAVGIRSGAKKEYDPMDISKVYISSNPSFQLYSLSGDNAKLSSNVLPEGTKSVKLCLSPGQNGGRLILHASRLESIDNAWLEDLLTNKIVDLKNGSGSYRFDSSPTDLPERFVVHFSNTITDFDAINNRFLQCHYTNGELVVQGLNSADYKSIVSIMDMQGRILHQANITQLPEVRIPVVLPEGIYIAKLTGKRCLTQKFKKGI